MRRGACTQLREHTTLKRLDGLLGDEGRFGSRQLPRDLSRLKPRGNELEHLKLARTQLSNSSLPEGKLDHTPLSARRWFRLRTAARCAHRCRRNAIGLGRVH